jgi:hypothetical protein
VEIVARERRERLEEVEFAWVGKVATAGGWVGPGLGPTDEAEVGVELGMLAVIGRAAFEVEFAMLATEQLCAGINLAVYALAAVAGFHNFAGMGAHQAPRRQRQPTAKQQAWAAGCWLARPGQAWVAVREQGREGWAAAVAEAEQRVGGL